jgi:adenosylhomocysteine nucleosidase
MSQSWRLFIGLVAVFAVLLTGSLGVYAQEKLDDTPRIAVMSAFAPELGVLLSETAVAETYSVNGVEFTTGELAGNDVVLFLSGVSMVNATMNTQLLLDHFNVTHVIFSGIAGGVNPELHIGDVIVAEQWAQYQDTFYARETEDGVFTPPPWFTPAFEAFGMMFPDTVNIRTADTPEGEEMFWFAVDADMLAAAAQVAEAVELTQCTADEVCLEHEPQIMVGGNGVSGPTFVDNAAYREYAFETFEANVLDMESAASATVAYANGVPFVAFRSLSDLAGGGPGENEIGTFFQVAADNSAAVVIEFLTVWAAQ